MTFKNDPRCSLLPPLEPISVNDNLASTPSRGLPVCGCWVGSHDYLICETCGKPVCRKHAATFGIGYPLECPICYEDSLEGRCQELLHQVEVLRDALTIAHQALGISEKGADSRVHYEHLISDITSYIESNGFRVLEASTTLPGDGGLVVRESHVQEPIIITAEMDIHKQWYEESRQITLDALPDFISHLINDYQHDYGTVCHALAAGALATLWAMNNTPQGGITGLQASAIMWQLIRGLYTGNKTSLRIIDYDDFLYPQYEDDFTQKTISKDIWGLIQKEAKNNIKEADEAHAKYLKDMKQYEKDLAAFVEKYPDYYERKDYYDHISCGPLEAWNEYEAKADSGFEFAPRKPYVTVDLEGNVYKHWKAIVNGVVPFGYTVGEEDE